MAERPLEGWAILAPVDTEHEAALEIDSSDEDAIVNMAKGRAIDKLFYEISVGSEKQTGLKPPLEASLVLEARIAKRVGQEPEIKGGHQAKGKVGPWLTRIPVFLKQDVGRALAAYMTDMDDYRPGAILGGFTIEALTQRGYLAKPVEITPVGCKEGEHDPQVRLEEWPKARNDPPWFPDTRIVVRCRLCGLELQQVSSPRGT